MAGFEEEIALIIRSENPQEVADKIAELKKINGHILVEQPDQFIVDTYYDTPLRAIKGAKHSVRIRYINGEAYVTIKGPSIKGEKGANPTRTEHEVKWPYEIPAEEMFELFGLERVQVRTCKRRVRDVLGWSGKEVVAELAIDDLTYLFGESRKARIFEVEIERKGKNNASLQGIAAGLVKKNPELEKWDHSKFSMGHLLGLTLLINTEPETGVLNDISFDVLDYLLS